MIMLSFLGLPFLGLLYVLLFFTTEEAASLTAIPHPFLPFLFYSARVSSRLARRPRSAGFVKWHASSASVAESELPAETIREVLSAQFQEVFAHFRRHNHSFDEDRIRTNLLRTRHAQLPLRHCRVSESTIPKAGRGVFCTRDVKAGETITLYPGDALLQWRDRHHVAEDRGLSVLFGTHIPEEARRAALDANASVGPEYIFMRNIRDARNYEVRISDTVSLIGDPWRCHDPAYLGHMINDFFTVAYNETVDGSNDDDKVERQYNIKSIAASNCQIVVGIPDGCHVEIVATRDIAMGEECFLSYGVDYWRTRLLRRHSLAAPTKRDGEGDRESQPVGFAVKKKPQQKRNKIRKVK
jgi:SET domain